MVRKISNVQTGGRGDECEQEQEQQPTYVKFNCFMQFIILNNLECNIIKTEKVPLSLPISKICSFIQYIKLHCLKSYYG